MIIRVWHGRTSPTKAEGYQSFLKEMAYPDYGDVRGNRGWILLRRPVSDTVEFMFVSFWDSHRFPVPLRDKGVTLAFEAVVLAGVALAGSSMTERASARLLLRMVAIGGVAALALAIWSAAASGWMPDWIVALMPGRMLNVSIMLLPPLIFGLLGASRGLLVARVWLLLLAAGLLIPRGSTLCQLAGGQPPGNPGASAVLAFGTAGALLAVVLNRRAPAQRPSGQWVLGAALIGVFVLSWFAFARLRPRLLVLLSVGSGLIAAIGATWAVFGELHLITLVFGASLVGVAENYATSYYSARIDQPAEDRHALMRAQLPTTALALLTTLYTNPFTIVPLYFVAYTLGAWVLGGNGYTFTEPPSLGGMGPGAWVEAFGHWLASLGKPLALGLVMLASLLATLGYVAVKLGWRWHLLHQWRRRRVRHP